MSIRRFFNRGRWDDERARELEAHLAMETDENIARGMTPGDAAWAARRKLGNITRIREHIYDMNSVSTLETARLDLRDAWRQLRRRPLTALLAFLLMTIGIGASAAAWSIAYGVLVRPLAYPDAERLAVLWQEVRRQRGQLSYPDFQDLRKTVPFDAAALFGSGRATLNTVANADRINLVVAESPLLGMLGARPAIGRLLEPGDEGRSVAVLSDRIWRSAFRADPNVLGRAIGVGGSQYTVVGVTAPGLEFELPVGPSVVGPGFVVKDIDLWTPFNLTDGVVPGRAVSTYEALVRLKPGQTIESAQAALDVAAENLARAYPATNRNRGFRLSPFGNDIVMPKSPAVLIGCAGASLILVVAFANLLSLFLGELPARRRDLALREALGASRGRLVRQVAFESAILALSGGVAGLLLARAVVGSFKAAAGLPRLDAIRFDVPVTACAVAAALVTGIVSRLLPLVRLRPAHESLRSSGRTCTPGAPSLRRVLVTTQLGLAVVLCAMAALLAVSLREVILVDPGFAASHGLSLRASAYSSRYAQKDDVVRLFGQAVNRVRELPGVQHVAAASAVPLAGGLTGTAVGVEGQPVPVAERPTAGWQTVTPDYFATLGVPILKGRDFQLSDRDRPTHQTVINEALARRIFGDADPIGRRLTFGPDQHVPDWHEVIAVVGDVRHASLTEAPAPRAYDLFGQHWGRTMYLVSRTSLEPYSIAPAIRGAIHDLDREMPVFEVQSLDDIVDTTLTPRRLATGFATGIAGVSLLLAAIGLYGLVASSVAARTRELGIRRALGSSTAAIVRLVSGEVVVMTLVGAASGIAAALAASRVMQSQLFGIRATDARVVVATATLLALVGAAATVVPARRAAGVDPAIALKEE